LNKKKKEKEFFTNSSVKFLTWQDKSVWYLENNEEKDDLKEGCTSKTRKK
jgi:hypothetical protein